MPEAAEKSCRRNRREKNGDRMQRNMPYFVRLVVDYFYDRMRKTKKPSIR